MHCKYFVIAISVSAIFISQMTAWATEFQNFRSCIFPANATFRQQGRMSRQQTLLSDTNDLAKNVKDHIELLSSMQISKFYPQRRI